MKAKAAHILTFLASSLLFLVPWALAYGQTYDVKFEDATESGGLTFKHDIAHFHPLAKNVMPWVTAGGSAVAVGDYNNDGLDDIYFTTSGEDKMNHLYRNEGNMQFTEVGGPSGLGDVNREDTGTSSFALWFDYDNDGWQDLLLLRFGYSSLYRNNGDETFSDVTESAGMRRLLNALAALSFDYDRDGDLDLYIGGYFKEKDLHNLTDSEILFESWETARNGGDNYLLRNNGDGTFTDVTTQANLHDTGWAMAVGHGDFDNDGWQDLYIANDFGTDKIFRNNGDGSFEDRSLEAIGIDTKKGMNAEIGDFNNDGWLDIYVTNMTEPYLHECNMLWKNNGDFTFTDVSVETNSCDTDWGWGSKFFDMDNDGLLDMYVANGFISSGERDYMDKLLDFVFQEEVNLPDVSLWPAMDDYSMGGYERNVLFHQTYGGFQSVGKAAGVDDIRDARGVATSDFDLDGRVDLVVSNVNAPAQIYRNVTEAGHHWIGFRLAGQGSTTNTSAIGARIALRSGLYTQMREVAGGNGFEAISSLAQHFGIKHAEKVDEVTVTWPDGSQQRFTNLKADRLYTIRQGEEPMAFVPEAKPAPAPASDVGGTSATNDPGMAPPLPATKSYFADISQASGAAVRHHPPKFDQELDHIMAMVAAGAAGAGIGDYNNDGYMDIFVNDAQRGTANYLLRNNGDLTFTEVADAAGVARLNDDNQVSTMGLFFDYNGDGWQDLLVVRFGNTKLMRNKGDGTFEDVSAASGLNTFANALAAVIFDYDRDGDLDVYLGAYFRDLDMFDIESSNVLHDSWEVSRNGGSNVFYRNNGDGTFTDITKAAGLEDTGWTMAVGHGDLDNDGWQDLYVANDYGPDKVFRNNHDGTFEDVTLSAIGVDSKKGMNAELGDYDNDGDLDLYVTNVTEDFLYECNMLWKNNGDMTFTDISTEMNVCDTGWGWGGKFFDYDNDGWQDLYVANGFFGGEGKGDYLDVLLPALWDTGEDPSDPSIWPPLDGMGIAGMEKNAFFVNVRGMTFVRDPRAGLDFPSDSRGIFTADFDNDGRVDVFVTNQNADTNLFHNQTENDFHYLVLDLVGQAPNTNAIGARVTAEAGGFVLTREVNCGNGFGGGSSHRVHLGLGVNPTVDRLTIKWPNGETQSFENLKADRFLRIKQGQTSLSTLKEELK